MAHRTFTDVDGITWQVWDTIPSGAGGMVQDAFAEGWLTFESEADKRRLAPIPATWSSDGEALLARYCVEAAPVRRGGLLKEHAAARTGEAAPSAGIVGAEPRAGAAEQP